MRPLALVPARGSSRRFPRKNLAPLGGRPLLAWTLEPALASGVFDAVWVSSEDGEVLETAQRHGARPLERPPALADDRATVADVCRDALGALERQGERFDALYVLLPTTPFRSADSIRRAWERFRADEAEGLLSLVPMEHVPQYAYVQEGGWARPWLADESLRPRVDLPVTYRHDGGHLIVRVTAFRAQATLVPERTIAFPVPVHEALDVNWPLDLEWAEFLLERRRRGT